MPFRSLKQLIRQNPTPDEYSALKNNIEGYPDRAVAIILSTHVEDKLEFLLSLQLRPDLNKQDKARILEGDGFLSRFSDKILFAFALGFIGPETRKDLTRLKDIRNAFAHARTDISFETPEIAAACAQFEIPDNPRFRPITEEDLAAQPAMQLVKDWHDTYSPPKEPRERFLTTTNLLIHRLWSAANHVMHHVEPMSPASAVP